MEPTEPTLKRPYLRPSGEIVQVNLLVCRCGERQRGPAGGVCGNRGGAIPDETERGHDQPR